jgi:hypothetical protein
VLGWGMFDQTPEDGGHGRAPSIMSSAGPCSPARRRR